MTYGLAQKRVAFLVADGFEQIELMSPRASILQAGGRVDIVSPNRGRVRGWNHTDWGESVDVDVRLTDADPLNYDALVLPGGVMNPDSLRQNAKALTFVRSFFDQHKPVAAICHGPWTLIDAGVVGGRRMTSYPSIRADLMNAGASWVDEEVVCDQGLVTSRTPDDLDAFNAKLLEEIDEGVHAEQHA